MSQPASTDPVSSRPASASSPFAELTGQVEQELQRLERLQRAEDARHGAEDARLRAIAVYTDAVTFVVDPERTEQRGAPVVPTRALRRGVGRRGPVHEGGRAGVERRG